MELVCGSGVLLAADSGKNQTVSFVLNEVAHIPPKVRRQAAGMRGSYDLLMWVMPQKVWSK
jgi:hypothetical protein